ncbi:hypothetical protein HPP92_019318 [Vanilla planifolia]|uniref:5-oxoprolinase n=1 Tax=Vanilla planifolia TaxID=51239 RepID=A0A835Q3U1_VANPL|nr:hypothetical protein HPP92_019318 [Vanilla planifolia]
MLSLKEKEKGLPFCVTRGFKDLLQIGNQARPNIFDLRVSKPSNLYEEVIEADERIELLNNELRSSDSVIEGVSGELLRVLKPLDTQALKPLLKVPRGLTASVDAYLTPVIKEYLSGFMSRFEGGAEKMVVWLQKRDFLVIKAVLSGPAGGVVGYSQTTFGLETSKPLIGFDMGGTSTDVSRYDGSYEQVLETQIAGAIIQAPQLDINTVAAGGGSKLKFQFGSFRVGPESVGAHPGPVCYRKGGELAITDANLILGTIIPDYFPSIFGPNENQPLDVDSTRKEFEKLSIEINSYRKSQDPFAKPMTVEEIALGFVNVANETMCRPMRQLTEMKGTRQGTMLLLALEVQDPSMHVLLPGHWVCPKLSSTADVVEEVQEPYSSAYNSESVIEASRRELNLRLQVQQMLREQGFKAESITTETYINLRYEGTDTAIMVKRQVDGEGNDFSSEFVRLFQQEYGFKLQNRNILISDVRVRGIGVTNILRPQELEPASETPVPEGEYKIYFTTGWQDTPLFKLEKLGYGHILHGPAIIMNGNSTVIVEPKCKALITKFMGIAEQMGRTLQRTSISTNIKERLDFSCALFSPDGGLVANAPHVPVHLGAMSTSRGHHAEIGGITPGSMPPFSKAIWEEGASIKAFKMVDRGVFQEEGIIKLLQSPSSGENSGHKVPGTRRLQDNLSDLRAQVAANQRGISLIKELIDQYGLATVQSYMIHVQRNAEEAVREMLKSVAAKVEHKVFSVIEEEDFMDDGSVIHLKLSIDAKTGEATFDFEGTSPEVYGNWNAPRAGCMNNLTFGDHTFGYYETIGGGCGAGPTWNGTSGVQCHMTNTRMTDPEIFEQRYPVLLHRFGLRENSGGAGFHRGGDGIVREIEFRRPVVVSILSERRVHAPRGLKGGGNGLRGANYLIRNDKRRVYLGGKNSLDVYAGEILQILLLVVEDGDLLRESAYRAFLHLDEPGVFAVTLDIVVADHIEYNTAVYNAFRTVSSFESITIGHIGGL